MVVRGPRLLLLDEPTSALDLRHQLVVLRLVQALAAERAMAVVIVLHDLEAAARVSDRVQNKAVPRRQNKSYVGDQLCLYNCSMNGRLSLQLPWAKPRHIDNVRSMSVASASPCGVPAFRARNSDTFSWAWPESSVPAREPRTTSLPAGSFSSSQRLPFGSRWNTIFSWRDENASTGTPIADAIF